MHDFKFRKGELYCEGARVSSVAKKVGTPFYLYSRKTLVDHFNKIRRAFASIDPLICFSMKSNGNLAVVKTLINQGSGIDIVSGGELRKALRAGADPKKIVFASVGKTEEEISLAVRSRILLFNIESEPELIEVNRIARKLGRKIEAALRINPDVEAPTHSSIVTGTLQKKFGVDLKTARKILRNQRCSNVKIVGVHIHIGSQITVTAPFVKAIKRVARFINTLHDDGIELKYLDIGGGMGINYRNEGAQTAKKFAKAVLPLLKSTGLKIILEPGRFITGNAGIFVTKVLYVKDNGVKRFLIVDGGMNDLIRPALYNSYHEIVPVKKSSAKKVKLDVVGPICESGDFLAKDRKLPLVPRNSLLAVMSAGAYGYVMSSNYNVRCRVPEIIVKGTRFAVTKRREWFEDLLKGETVPKFIK